MLYILFEFLSPSDIIHHFVIASRHRNLLDNSRLQLVHQLAKDDSISEWVFKVSTEGFSYDGLDPFLRFLFLLEVTLARNLKTRNEDRMQISLNENLPKIFSFCHRWKQIENKDSLAVLKQHLLLKSPTRDHRDWRTFRENMRETRKYRSLSQIRKFFISGRSLKRTTTSRLLIITLHFPSCFLMFHYKLTYKVFQLIRH